MSGREFVDTNIWLYALVEPGHPVESDKHHHDWYPGCDLHPSNEEQHLLASRLREAGSFSFWDSLILAAALDAGCEKLYSEDMQHGQVVDGRLTIVNPLLG